MLLLIMGWRPVLLLLPTSNIARRRRKRGWWWWWNLRLFSRNNRFVNVRGHPSVPPVIQPGFPRGRSAVRIQYLLVIHRFAGIVQLRQRSLRLFVQICDPGCLPIGIGPGFCGGCGLLDKFEFLLEPRQLVLGGRFLLLSVGALHVSFRFLDFLFYFSDCFGLDGLFVAFLDSFVLALLEFFLASLFVVLLHWVGTAPAFVAASHDGVVFALLFQYTTQRQQGRSFNAATCGCGIRISLPLSIR